MRRVSPVRLGTTLRLAFPGRSIPPSGNQFRKSRFHAPRQGQGAGTLWHPQAQANPQFGECRWAGWKAGKLETGTWGLGMEMEVMCDKGCAACSVFSFLHQLLHFPLDVDAWRPLSFQLVFSPSLPALSLPFLLTPALTLHPAHARPRPRLRPRPPRRDRFDTSSINPSLDEFFFVFCVVGASWAPIAPGDPEPTVLSRSANERNNRDLFPRHRISIHPRIQIHLEWPWCLRRCEKKTISGIGKFHELHQALAPRLFLSLDLHLDPTRNRRPHPLPAMISSQVARRWATIAIATLLLSSMVVAEPSIPTNYCSSINTADMEPCTPPSP